MKYLHLVGGLGPAISGLVCARLIGGRSTFRLLLGRIGRWRVPVKWHLVAWLGPFVVLTAALGAARLWGAVDLHGVGLQSVELADLPLALYGLCVIIFYGFGEEIGWRGFALPVLQNRFSALQSTLILTMIWAVWHMPLFWFSPGLASLGLGGVIGWGLSLLTGAIILTWLTNSTGGSVFIAAGLHVYRP